MVARLNLASSHRNNFVKHTIYNVYLVFLQVPQTGSPNSQHLAGYGSPGGTPTPSSSATLAAAVAAGFSDVVFTSSNVSVNNQEHLIYDSINMSQVQNYTPSLSSSLGKFSISTCLVLQSIIVFVCIVDSIYLSFNKFFMTFIKFLTTVVCFCLCAYLLIFI